VRRSLSHPPSTPHTCCNMCDSPTRCAAAPRRVRRRVAARAPALPGVRQLPRGAPATGRSTCDSPAGPPARGRLVRRRRTRRRAGAARSRS
jgi:hypothetical protein